VCLFLVLQKMGIRARDYFGISPDLLEIGSYSGSLNLSAVLNDGSSKHRSNTGSGKIHLINDTIARPQAVFTYGNQ